MLRSKQITRYLNVKMGLQSWKLIAIIVTLIVKILGFIRKRLLKGQVLVVF